MIMKFGAYVTIIFQLLLLTSFTGCKFTQPEEQAIDSGALEGFMPTHIRILPLTEFTSDGDNLRVYAAAFDRFDTQIKTPGIFRFELYERIPRSSEPKGRRLKIWSDFNLTEAQPNNEHWRDFIRAYEFNLDFDREAGQSYILQATLICPGQRRLTDQFNIDN